MIEWIKRFIAANYMFRQVPAKKFTGFEIRLYRRGVLMHESISLVTDVHSVNFPIPIVMPDDNLLCTGFMLFPKKEDLERNSIGNN